MLSVPALRLPLRLRAATSLVVAFVALGIAGAGCAAQDDGEELGSGDSALTGDDLGRIRNGETKTGSYPAGGASHRSFSFRAAGGDTVTADVGIAGGDAVAFITDANGTVIAQNDNSGGSLDAKVTTSPLPAGPSRTLRIVFKEKTQPSASYTVRLGIQQGQCNPSSEPWYTYRSTDVEECRSLFIECGSNEAIFKNACGCGCERPNP